MYFEIKLWFFLTNQKGKCMHIKFVSTLSWSTKSWIDYKLWQCSLQFLFRYLLHQMADPIGTLNQCAVKDVLCADPNFFSGGEGGSRPTWLYFYNVNSISSDGGNSRSAHVSLVYRISVRTASIFNLKGHYSIITHFFVQCLSFRLITTISWTVRCITKYLTNRI